MCGIVGVAARRPVANLLLEGLKKLEYRGYDSAGLACVDTDQQLTCLRVVGKVKQLESALTANPVQAHTGIAHTRWATHGAPSEKNAHPFISHDEFALVHNGIIENHSELRQQLTQDGYQFHSDTDTEVIVHLIHQQFKHHQDLLKSIHGAVSQLKGAYALGIITKQQPGRIIAVRHGSPLVVGIGKSENYIASDPLALLALTQDFIYLEDNDLADVSIDSVQIFDKDLNIIKRKQHQLTIKYDAIERGEYRHFMAKEINDQPDAVAACLEGRISDDHVMPAIFGPQAEEILPTVDHIQLVACGTSYHAAMVARYWVEEVAKIPCTVEIASEFRYRKIAPTKNSLFVTLSQSGETADTLAALRLAKEMDYLSTLVICNVPGSTMTREADWHFLTRAGVEIGVASTKAFVTQLVSLFLFALVLRRTHTKDHNLENELVAKLRHLPVLMNEVLQENDAIKEIAQLFSDSINALFLGRGSLYPIALEGALKMKEISYIHAEGYPAGELKHGPLALVDNNMPVIATVPNDSLLEKNLSNLHEVRTRGGQIYVFTDQTHLFDKEHFAGTRVIKVPTVHPLLAPILYTVPLQLLAYHVAVIKGTDVDQPRNLAKSVTVE